jgi:hypothetical protein
MAVCALNVATLDEPRWQTSALLVFLSAIGLMDFVLGRARRAKLLVDIDGFQIGTSRKTMWREVESFAVMNLPTPRFGRQLKVVTFKYAPGFQRSGKVMSATNRLVGADGCIPMTWPRPHEAIADELNEYRRLAIDTQVGWAASR